MKLYEITTQCGAKMQAGKLTQREKEVGLTWCPIPCPFCGSPHGWEMARSIKKVKVSR